MVLTKTFSAKLKFWLADQCAKTLEACNIRWGEGSPGAQHAEITIYHLKIWFSGVKDSKMILLNKKTKTRIKEQSIREAPSECCGLIVKNERNKPVVFLAKT